ncbi:oligosaccharide flippase family protein [Desulfitobacterium hafniense]|nr:oligosaccharide flippase family protein [Desulfitobacterium hafniense]
MYNLSYALIAQLVSLILSILMSLVVPKVLGIESYAYWQLFIFYITYVVICHFGLTDGIYLRLGGTNYEDLNYRSLGSQLWLMVGWQLVIGIFVIIGSLFYINDIDSRRFVWLMTSLYMIFANITWYLGCIFQAVNQTNIYSISIIISKAICIIGGGTALFLGLHSWRLFIIVFVAGQMIAVLYCIVKGKQIVFAGFWPIKQTFSSAWENIKIGINLTLSGIASSLILGCGRGVMDYFWDIESFGKFSFSLSLTNFFLQFVSQISMVLFPALRQSDLKTQFTIFVHLRNAISYIFCGLLFLYLPTRTILLWWLPQYEESIRYLAILLPICIFDGKMQLLCNTYLKVLRKEKVLLRINLISVVCSLILSFVGALLFDSKVFVVLAMVFTIALRSFIAERYLSRCLKCKNGYSFYAELILSIAFGFMAWYLNIWTGTILFGLLFASYLWLSKNKIKDIISAVTILRNIDG